MRRIWNSMDMQPPQNEQILLLTDEGPYIASLFAGYWWCEFKEVVVKFLGEDEPLGWLPIPPDNGRRVHAKDVFYDGTARKQKPYYFAAGATYMCKLCLIASQEQNFDLVEGEEICDICGKSTREGV